jgi:hypothetical protein
VSKIDGEVGSGEGYIEGGSTISFHKLGDSFAFKTDLGIDRDVSQIASSPNRHGWYFRHLNDDQLRDVE